MLGHPTGLLQRPFLVATRAETSAPAGEALVTTPGLLRWRSRKLAEGAKGPLVASFARVRVSVSAERTPASERWLLVRNDPGGKLKYALSNAPETEPFGELIRVSAARWPIERCFQEDKSELGLDHYEHRSWTAWHRHMHKGVQPPLTPPFQGSPVDFQVPA